MWVCCFKNRGMEKMYSSDPVPHQQHQAVDDLLDFTPGNDRNAEKCSPPDS